jgi:hypothetical protein
MRSLPVNPLWNPASSVVKGFDFAPRWGNMDHGRHGAPQRIIGFLSVLVLLGALCDLNPVIRGWKTFSFTMFE